MCGPTAIYWQCRAFNRGNAGNLAALRERNLMAASLPYPRGFASNCLSGGTKCTNLRSRVRVRTAVAEIDKAAIPTCGIAVMAKASIAGRTKTRLVPPLTFEEAAQCNTAFLRAIAA